MPSPQLALVARDRLLGFMGPAIARLASPRMRFAVSCIFKMCLAWRLEWSLALIMGWFGGRRTR